MPSPFIEIHDPAPNRARDFHRTRLSMLYNLILNRVETFGLEATKTSLACANLPTSGDQAILVQSSDQCAPT